MQRSWTFCFNGAVSILNGITKKKTTTTKKTLDLLRNYIGQKASGLVRRVFSLQDDAAYHTETLINTT